MSNSIEDVLITNNYTNKKKKRHPVLFFFFILIIIALAGLIYYKHYYNVDNVVDYTGEFFQYTSTTNSSAFFNDSLYSELLKKLETRDYESETSINFSSTIKNEELKDIDIGKLVVNVDTISKSSEENKFFNFNVKYLDNSIINAKALEKKDDLYVISEEIVNMYVGGNKKEFYPILSTILNKDWDFSKIENVKNLVSNRIEYSEFDIKKYTDAIKLNIEPGKVKKKENVIIENEDESLTTTAYELELTKDETNKILTKLLEVLKEDEKILTKLADKEERKLSASISNLNTVGENENIEQILENTQLQEQTSLNQITDETNNFSNEILNETVENTVQEEPERSIQVIENNNLNENEDKVVVENILSEIQNSGINENKVLTIEADTSYSLDENTKTLEEALKILKRVIKGDNYKIYISDLQASIQAIIDNIDKINESSTKLSTYIYKNQIVKLSFEIYNKSSLDIEFDRISEKENEIIITYLDSTEKNNGFSIELYKNKKEAATSFNIIFNNIENKRITKKIKLETRLEGTVLSNSINNSILLTYLDSSGEFKANLNIDTTFDTNKQIEILNETNSFNIVTAEDVYKQNLIDQLKNTIENTYNGKKERMKLIDRNTSSSEISSNIPTTEERKNEVRQVLFNKISNMMTEAVQNGEKFELRNLNGLEIEGYRVSTIINPELAIITIDGYTFNIDSEFNLSDG